jgi:glucose-6-phosphate dehydrogenase assembly protein OpcA
VTTEPTVVDIRSVDKELTRLWRQTAEGGLPGVSAPVTRVLLANLLVYALTDAEADEAQAIVADMAAEYPTRTVVTDAQPGKKGESYDAGISVLCDINEQGARLCGESIRLHIHETDHTGLGTIIPLLVPDLPIYLWTPGDIAPEDDTLRQLARSSDHWIVDSRRLSQWTSKIEVTESLTSEAEASPHLHDLAWTWLRHWRETIAEIFDPASMRNYLAGVTSVRIVYKPETSDLPAVEAVMTASWIMRQLDWTGSSVGKDGDDWVISVHSEQRGLLITLHPETTASRPITEVVIESEVDGRRARIQSSVVPGSEEVTTEVDAPDIPCVRRTVNLPSISRCREVCHVLDAPGADRLYEHVLPVILTLARQIDEAK